MLGWCSGFLLGLCWGSLLICPETLCVSGIDSCWPASPVPSPLSCFTDLHGGLEMGSCWPGSGSVGLLQHCPPVRNMAPSAHRRRRSSSRNWPKNKGRCVSSYRCVALLPLDPRIPSPLALSCPHSSVLATGSHSDHRDPGVGEVGPVCGPNPHSAGCEAEDR